MIPMAVVKLCAPSIPGAPVRILKFPTISNCGGAPRPGQKLPWQDQAGRLSDSRVDSTHTQKSPNSASPTQHYTDAVKPDDLCTGLLEGGLCHDRPSQPCLPLVETVAASVHLEDNIGRVQLLSAHPPSPPYARIVLPSWTKSWM